MNYLYMEHILVGTGVVFMALSLIKYYRRTGDHGVVRKVWFRKLELNKNEYLLNRAGIYILILGIIVRFMNHFLA